MMGDIRKILILRFSSLGDIIMSTPMIRCLRAKFPRAQIDMVVRSDFMDLIRFNPHLDRKFSLPRESGIPGLLALLRDLNRERYDFIYDAHRSTRTLVLMPFLKSQARAFYKKHYLRRSLALTFKLPLLRPTRMLEKYIEPLADLGVRYDGLGPELFLNDEIRLAALRLLTVSKIGTLSTDKSIGIIPSAQWPGKRWPMDHFRKVIFHIVESTHYGVFVFGGSRDHFCKTLCDGFPEDRVFNAQGALRIALSAALIERCSFVIANDTGLMHVADALGVPSVLILGPTSGEMGCIPFHPESRIVEEKLWCRPCSKNGQAVCIRGRRLCLERILAERVFDAAKCLMVAPGSA